MTPNRSNNYCCGGGGGFLQSGMPEARRAYGKLKADQIIKTALRTPSPPAITATPRSTT
jgi:Fe-S oxidoreductase